MPNKLSPSISICSYSFHRLLTAGKQDIFKYVQDCKELGCTHLQPWNVHFRGNNEDVVEAGTGIPWDRWTEAPTDSGYIRAIRQAADEAGLPFEMIAADKTHIFDEDEEVMRENRRRACDWIRVAAELGASGVRIDSGGVAAMDEPMLKTIVEGFQDVIQRGRDAGVDIYIENHWGASNVPENIIRFLMEIEDLKLLFDSHNWAKGRQEEAWDLCAKYADASHLKTFRFDAAGNESTVDIPKIIGMLVGSGYDGIWGIESVPREVDEITGASLTIALLKKTLAEYGGNDADPDD